MPRYTATSTNPPNFTWSQVTGVGSYQLWLYDQQGHLIQKVSVSVGSLTDQSHPNYQWPTALTSGRSYRWYIDSVSTNGQAVSENGPVDFTIT